MLPTQIFSALRNLPPGFAAEHWIISRIYSQLPRCKQRAIASLHCSMLEDEYKELCSIYKTEHNYDLHQKFRGMIEEVYKRRP